MYTQIETEIDKYFIRKKWLMFLDLYLLGYQ